MTNTRRYTKCISSIVMAILLLCAVLSPPVLAEDLYINAIDTNSLDTETLIIAKNVNLNTHSIVNPYGFVLPVDDMNLIVYNETTNPNGHIYSPFGPRNGKNHNGIDIAWGDMYRKPIKAVYGGTTTIIQDGDGTGYGCYAIIDHGLVNGEYLKTVYAHMDSNAVLDGTIVTQGQVIGYVGDTGDSDGNHLHFEVRVGAASSMWQCTPVDPIPYLTGAGTSRNPQGNYESATSQGGTVTVKGWAFDQDDPSVSLRIDVYIGGPAGSANAVGCSLGVTDVARSDVNAAYSISGVHGFEKTITTTKRGSQDVYVYAINIGEGTHTELGCMTVNITGNPIGRFETATSEGGTVTVEGWAFDYDDPSASLRIDVYIGGPAGSANAKGYVINATDQNRPDVNAAYSISGVHGYDKTITTTKRGSQDVYVYAINVSHGTHTLLGRKTVDITGNPVGDYESAISQGGTVTVKGWAFDYDDPSASLRIDVYIGGSAGSANAKGYVISETDVTRSDINATYNINGTHGFEYTITTDKRGTQLVYVYAMNIDSGTHTLLGHKTVNITGNPIGDFEIATGGDGTVFVKGWAFDHDDPSASLRIDVYIGGPAGSANAVGYGLGLTDIMRTDVNTTYSISGVHGFEKTITTTKTGVQQVYVYAINIGTGTHTLLGSKTVTVT